MTKINELQLAKELIKFPSVTPLDAGIMKFLEKKLKTLGFKTNILEFKEKNSKPVKNLYAKLGNKSPNFCYAGHLDVVPAGNLKDWSVSPFKPAVKRGHLIGRGANDMKSSIAAFVSAVDNFIKDKKKFNGSISFLITGDEEGAAINGTKKVVDYLKKKKEKINFCLVGEPTNPNKLGEMIKIGRRGSITGKLTVIGSQGHVAYPHLAKNPIHQAMSALKHLVEEQWDEGNNDFPPTTLQISNISAGSGAVNMIPGRLTATFNFRFSTELSERVLKERTSAIMNQYGLNHKLDWQLAGEPFLTNWGTLVQKAGDSISNIIGYRPELSTAGGTSDARFIAPMGTEVIELGPVNKTIHQVNEHVRVSDLEKLTDIYQDLLKRMLNRD